MVKRKPKVVDPEAFDPDVPSEKPVVLPGKPDTKPAPPGDEDDSDDERVDENEAVRPGDLEE